MEIIKHRINVVNEIDQKFGAEIDVRDHNGVLVLSHDYPNSQSQKLDDFIKYFPKERLLAVNVKSCGIEKDLFDILNDSKVKYFTFDFSFPYLLKAINNNLTCALRLSEYEKEIVKGPQWVWVDSFHSMWFDEKYIQTVKNLGYHIAIVSPELHGRNDKKEIEEIKILIKKKLIDAICTDTPEMWND